MYALHYDWHTTSTTAHIDAWHCKLLRRTMKWKTTYIDRSKTNQWVYKHTNTQPISTKITAQQFKFYGHIARAPGTLQHSVVFGPGQLRQLNTLRRVGRPRQHWASNVEQQLISFVGQSRPVPNRDHLHRICNDRQVFGKIIRKVCAAPQADGRLTSSPAMASGQ